MLAAAGIGLVAERRQYAQNHPPSQACDKTSSSAVEAQFDIDLIAISGLSFSKAKLIDLTWDIGIGHGGRLLHGWVFSHISSKTTTLVLEISSLPFKLVYDLLFQPDSLHSLRSLLRSFGRTQRTTTRFRMALLTYGVAHVLFFTTIWSAATGYKSTILDGYSMLDKSWVVKTSDDLRLCWSLDTSRVTGLNLTTGVVLGPQFASVFSSFEEIDAKAGSGMWSKYTPQNMTDDFLDVYACKIHDR